MVGSADSDSHNESTLKTHAISYLEKQRSQANNGKVINNTTRNHPLCRMEDALNAASNGTWIRHPSPLSLECAPGGVSVGAPHCVCQRAAQWKWQPQQCRLREMKTPRYEFAKHMPDPIIFIGDSMAFQMLRVLLNFLPPYCEIIKANSTPRDYSSKVLCRDTLVAAYYQNDFLCTHCNSILQGGDALENRGAEVTINWGLKRPQRDIDKMGLLQGTTIVINSGLHWTWIGFQSLFQEDREHLLTQYRANLRGFIIQCIARARPGGTVTLRLD